MTFSWLFYDLFMTCSWLVHDLLMTGSWLAHDLLMTWSCLAHDFLITFSWLAHDLVMTWSLLAHDLIMTCAWLAYDLFTTCSWLCLDFLAMVCAVSALVFAVSIYKLPFEKNKFFITLNLSECWHFEVYNGIYNSENHWKPEIFILDNKTHSYEIIFQRHIEEDQTQTVCFMRKNQFDQEKFKILEVQDFAITIELHFNGKILNPEFLTFFLIKLIFFS